jgi:hypothetical protein
MSSSKDDGGLRKTKKKKYHDDDDDDGGVDDVDGRCRNQPPLPSLPHVRVVLLCSGRGGDRAAFRPAADESQWWGRRDALVRCVAAFLFGPTGGGGGMGGTTTAGADYCTATRELVLLFDDDLARIHMMRADDGNASGGVPTEQTVIQLWKRAAQQLQRPVLGGGIRCTIFLDPADARIVATAAAAASYGGPSSSSTTNQHHANYPSGDKNGTNHTSNNRSTPPPPKKGTNQHVLPVGMDTKRQVLEYLQEHCSIDFLRTQGLNSKSDVILRKTNRKALVQVWHKWVEEGGQQGRRGPAAVPPPPQGVEGEDDDHPSRTDSSAAAITAPGETQQQEQQQQRQRRRLDERLASIYRDMLLQRPSHVPSDATTVAGTLHETGQEFPCFARGPLEKGPKSDKEGSQQRPLYLCLFLGAVRDMTGRENQLLEEVCLDAAIPRLAVRFGTVPEFTSKILSLLAFHHANGVVGPSIRRLLFLQQQHSAAPPPTPLLQRQQDNPAPTTNKGTHLSVVCAVPISSRNVSIDLTKRDRVHWCVVRVIVSTLWRSRVASQSGRDGGPRRHAWPSPPPPAAAVRHTNSLHLVFADGAAVHLDEATFVGRLASQHRSAPCEHQVLAALLQALAEQRARPEEESMGSSGNTAPTTPSDSGVDRAGRDLARQVIREAIQSSPVPVTCTIGLHGDAANGVTTRFYESPPPHDAEGGRPDQGVLLIMDIPPNGGDNGDGHPQQQQPPPQPVRRIYCDLLSASRAGGVPTTLEQAIVAGRAGAPVQDWEAASIVALQHFCYQNRVFGGSGQGGGRQAPPSQQQQQQEQKKEAQGGETKKRKRRRKMG